MDILISETTVLVFAITEMSIPIDGITLQGTLENSKINQKAASVNFV